jgi:hypothetical protein
MGAKTEIEKLNLTTLTCREALKHVAKIIHTLHDEGKVRRRTLLAKEKHLGSFRPRGIPAFQVILMRRAHERAKRPELAQKT